MSVSYANIIYLLSFISGLRQYLITAFNPDVVSEYDWEKLGLRSYVLTSKDKILQIICFNKCRMSDMCENNRCICSEKENEQSGESLDNALTPLRPVTMQDESKSFEDAEPYFNPNIKHLLKPNGLKHYEVSPRLETAIEIEDQPIERFAERPALRHHIAHFCPNLREARKCIRKCMKLGKPAFCGKDHVCYCGHRYGSNDHDQPLNVDDIYAQFRDLYTKYFGPQQEAELKS